MITPFSSNQPSPVTNSFKLQRISDFYYKIEEDFKKYPITTGDYMVFDGGARALVVGISPGSIVLFTDSKDDSVNASWESKEILSVKAFTSIAYLSAQVRVPVNHTPGSLGWSLYRGDELLCIGNDLYSRGYCKTSSEDLWPAGEYRLNVTLYDPLKSVLKVAQQDWKLDNPGKLECGGYYDSRPPIELL